jgi:hypothetical protein
MDENMKSVTRLVVYFRSLFAKMGILQACKTRRISDRASDDASVFLAVIYAFYKNQALLARNGEAPASSTGQFLPHKIRRGYSLARLILVSAIFQSPIALATNRPTLSGATFGYAETLPLTENVRLPVSHHERRVGGVAFIREAIGINGWTVVQARYEKRASDGSRLILNFSNQNGLQKSVRADLWDWELIPLLNYVASDTNGAFTLFGKRKVSSSQLGQAVAYHPAFKNSLMGLRFLQLDILLFHSSFRGLFELKGKPLFGAGEKKFLQKDIPSIRGNAELLAYSVSAGNRAYLYLANKCRSEQTRPCSRWNLPFDNYIVGDLRSPIKFDIQKEEIVFHSRGVCWSFTETYSNNGGVSKTADGTPIDLAPLSEEFCDFVSKQNSGVHPLSYRAADRAANYSSLFRLLKSKNRKEFDRLFDQIRDVKIDSIEIPTEILE